MNASSLDTSHFDLVVLGAGSGGIACAKRAAQHGARCAIVALGPIGGTCVHAGCIPKKLNWEAAHAMEAARLLGCASSAVDLGRLKRVRDAEIRRLQAVYEGSLDEAGIAVFRGRAVIEGEGCVSVHNTDGSGSTSGSFRLAARHVLVATGSEPIMPSSARIPGVDHCISSDDIWALTQLPQSMCIVGGGYIGVETASTFRCFGSDVSLVVREDAAGDGVLRGFDGSLRESVEQSLRAAGVHLHLIFGDLQRVDADADADAKGGDSGGGGSSTTPSSATATAAADNSLSMMAASGRTRQRRLFVVGTSGKRLGPFDTVLLALGRKPRTAGLGLGGAGLGVGVALHPGSGAVLVDDASHSVSHGLWLHAVGDVTGHKQLTPVAIAAGRLLADSLFGGFPSARMDYTNVPTALFAHPPLATVGLTQAEAEARFGREAVVCFERRFTPLANALSGASGGGLTASAGLAAESSAETDYAHSPKARFKLVCRRMSDGEAAADAQARQQCKERLTCDSANALCRLPAVVPNRGDSTFGSDPGGSCIDALQAVAARLCCPDGASGRLCGDVASESHGLLPGLEPLGSALEAALRERGRTAGKVSPTLASAAEHPSTGSSSARAGRPQAAAVGAASEGDTRESRLHDALLQPSHLRVLGLHVHAPGAHEMVQGLALAVKLGLSKAELDSVVAVHPTVAEEAVTLSPWMPMQGYSACESVCGCDDEQQAQNDTASRLKHEGRAVGTVTSAPGAATVSSAAGGAGRPGPRLRSS